jgi:hypothetical protein
VTLLRCELRGGPELFEGGIASDLANNVQVEAEGSWDQFTTNVGAGRSVIIQTDSLTTGSLPQVGTPCVQVRGQRSGLATPPVVTAGEIRTSCSNSDRPFMQAPVEAETSTSVTQLGFAIDVSNAQWENINGQPIPTLAATPYQLVEWYCIRLALSSPQTSGSCRSGLAASHPKRKGATD